MEKVTGSVFGEYGRTDIYTLVGAGAFGSDRDGTAFSSPAVFALSVAGRLRLWQGHGFVVSTQVCAFADHETHALGQRTMSWEMATIECRMLASYGFELGDWPAFVDLEVGYRYRLGERAPDELLGDATFGLRHFKHVQLPVQDFATISVRELQDVDPYDYHNLQGSVVYDLCDRGSVQTGGLATVSGRNALQERGVIAAVWYRF